MSADERPVLAPHLAGAVAQAGVDPTLEGRALQDGLRAAIATRRGYCSWDVDHAGWVVTLHSPEEQDFFSEWMCRGGNHCCSPGVYLTGGRGSLGCPPNGALTSRGRGRASVEAGSTPALWRSAPSWEYTAERELDHLLRSAV